jgi:hypothetical protein
MGVFGGCVAIHCAIVCSDVGAIDWLFSLLLLLLLLSFNIFDGPTDLKMASATVTGISCLETWTWSAYSEKGDVDPFQEEDIIAAAVVAA